MNKIGIIGYGNMGQAIAGGLKNDCSFIVFDKDAGKTSDIAGKDISVADNIGDLFDNAQIVILAVKPQDLKQVLLEISKSPSGIMEKLFISIAAGISTGYLEQSLGQARIIRGMPNLPMKIGKGMICLSKGRHASISDLKLAQELFGRLGRTLIIEEGLMDAATAVSGSGPGFFFALVESKPDKEIPVYARSVFVNLLAAAAIEAGFTPKQSLLLASATTEGSLALLSQGGLSPAALREQVTSKGGTTQAGLEVLQGEDRNLKEAVKAALKRAKELSKKE